MSNAEPLVAVKNIKKYYPVRQKAFFSGKGKKLHAVDGVSLEIYEGETFGLVGESGCGKTTLARQITGMEKPDQGQILYRGEPLDAQSIRKYRTQIQMVFQDPLSSLNPRRRVYDIIGDILIKNNICGKDETRSKVAGLLSRVGLDGELMYRYPGEFSGGQRQRIAIARAIAPDPKLIICDEAVSALDVSIQMQILELIKKLREELGISCLFIGHGLGAVGYISHRIGVMYLGRIVELASSEELFKDARHPYSRALISAIPYADPEKRNEVQLTKGEVPSAIDLPRGCAYAERCPCSTERCFKERPELTKIGSGEREHLCACFNPAEEGL